MRMNRPGRLLRRAPLLFTLLLPLVLAACATPESGGPSQDRTLDLLALAAGSVVLVTLGVLMYIDNQD